MAVKIGTPRSAEDKVKIGLLALLGAEYGVSGYVDDLHYYQGEESIRKAEILAKHMDNKKMGDNLISLIKESNAKMEAESHGGFRPNAGRKKELPEGARNRSITVTDEEYTKLKEYIAALRK